MNNSYLCQNGKDHKRTTTVPCTINWNINAFDLLIVEWVLLGIKQSKVLDWTARSKSPNNTIKEKGNK